MFRNRLVVFGLRISTPICLALITLLAAFSLSGCGGSSKPISVAVAASATSVDGADTVTLTATVTNDKNAGGVTWTVSGGGALSNTTTTSATYTAPAASSSAQTVTVTATSVASASETASATLTIPAAPSISTGALAAGTVGTSYSATLTATGGIAPYTWSLASGTLPSCLTLVNSASGASITGTPNASCAGTFTITLKVTDSGTPTALTATTSSITLTIAAAPAITFAGTVPAGTYNAAYTGSAAASGGAGALTYSISAGSLPTGLTLAASTGAISGTPTVTGTFPFTVKAVDAYGDSNTQAYSIVVTYPALTIGPATLVLGYVGSNYTQTTLTASGGSGTGYSWLLAPGSSLPTGLSLSTGGVITGKPTGTPGTTIFSVKVTDSASNSATGSFSITVDAGVSITTPLALPTGYVGGNYSKTMAASGGSGTGYTWSVTSGSTLPAGLILSSAGVLSGKPTTAGTPSFSVTVTDSVSNTASATFSMTISAGVSVTTPATLPNGYVGSAYSQALAATGGSGTGYSWALASGSTLPAGLSLAGNTISGSPTGAGVSTFSVTVTDSASNTASATLSLTIVAGLTITSPANLPAGYVGTNYSQTLTAAGGSGTGYSFVLANGSTLPAGLTLSTGGVISGKPTTNGPASFTVTVTDSLSHTANATLSITINAALSITTAAPLPTGYVGSNYTQTLAAAGGSGLGYTWAVSSGSTLPGGLTLSAAGVLSGKPTTAGTPSFSVTVTDSVSNTASATFTVTIGAGLTITTPTALPSGYQGTAYPGATLAATGGTGTGYNWAWTAASGSSLPTGLSLSTAGAISGTPTASGTFSVVITVTDSAQNSASATFSLTVEAKLAVTTVSPLKSGTINAAYSQSLAASGGSGTGYTWSTNTAGTTSLAAINLTLSPAGIVAGTPLSTGTATFAATLTDSQSHTTTATLTITVLATLTVTTTALPATYVGATYSQTLAAAGGTGTGYTWTATSSNLASYGLSLSTGGVITGTPTQSGTTSFTAKVTDSGTNTANAPLTITVYAGLSLPAPDPGSLPGTATKNVAYSGSITGSGGSGNYCYTVTGLPSDSLSSPAPNSPCGYVASSLPIAGTPGSAQTVTFTVKLTDTTTNASITQTGYNIVVSNPTPLTLPTPNPSSLPSATVNQGYTGQINSAGGVGPTYTWTVNSVVIPTNGTAVAESDGLSVSSTGGPTLFVTGTPTSINSVPLSVSVTDSASQTAGPDAYSVSVNSAGSSVSGQIFLTTGCSGPGNYPPITVSINTTPVQTTTTDSNGNYSFGSVPNGTYTITPSIAAAESVFFPASYTGVVVNNSTVSGKNFSATLGYTISGAVSYAGASTGRIFVTLNGGCNGGGLGTSMTVPGAFTIRGVPPGSYTVQASMDIIGQGAENALDPSGSAATTVTSANVAGADVTMTDPTVGIPTSGPSIQSIVPNAGGVMVSYSPVRNSNGLEEVSSYTVEWSTSSTFTTTSSYSFKAVGKNADVWILNNGLANMTGTFTSGTAYYFRARGEVAAGHGPWGIWGGGTPVAVTIGAPSGAGYNTVTGAVTIPSSITPTGPLYVGFYNQSNGSVYGIRIASPSNSTANAFTILVPTDTNPDYFFFGILDQNNDGLIDVGDFSNTDNSGSSGSLAITGNLTNQNLTLPAANSTFAVTTQFQQITCSNCGSTFNQYNLSFDLRKASKLPITATLTSGPNVIHPVDLGLCNTCGTPQFQYYFNIGGAVPIVGQSYGILVAYSDGTSETVNATVSAVLTASQLATGLSPSGPNSGSTTPDFTWTYPANAGNYLYSFNLSANNGNTIWSIPGNNSNTNGFTSIQIPVPAGIQFPTDPTDNTNSPSVPSLTSGATYNWQIQTQDTNGNQAQTQVFFIVP